MRLLSSPSPPWQRGLRGQAIFVDPASRLVLVHTSAGTVSGMSGDLLALWFSVTKTLAK